MAENDKGKQQAIGCGVLLLAVGGFAAYMTFTDPSSSAPEFVTMPGMSQYAMITTADMNPDQMVEAAKDKCREEDICSVFGWPNKSDMARAFPMSDRELATLTFKFAINRSTGYEARLWNCKIYTTKKGDECLSIL